MKRRLFLLLALALMSVGLNAQVLVFHLPNGEISTVAMPCTFTYSASGDKLIIDGSGTHIELQRDRILAMTYRANRGDSNGDMRVDVHSSTSGKMTRTSLTSSWPSTCSSRSLKPI